MQKFLILRNIFRPEAGETLPFLSLFVRNQSPFGFRCVWTIGRGTHRESSGEVAVCARRVLQDAVPQPAHAVRQTPAPVTLSQDCQFASD